MNLAILLFRLLYREFRRFGWTVYWALIGSQILDQVYEQLIEGEEENNYFAQSGKPFPTCDELEEIILDEMAIEGRL